MKIKKIIFLLGFSCSIPYLHATNLSIGADYLLRGVSTHERDKNFKNSAYYDQRLQGYLTTDLSRDVEASIRIQSITPWGLEGSSTPLVTRYPSANGNLFVQNAFARLPHLWKDRIILTIGRQPIQWGDGKILSDDELGFNAIRAQLKSPFRRLPFDLEGFTAKISESLNQPGGDKDLYGSMLSFDSKAFRWDFMGLWEKSDGSQSYQVGSSSTPFAATKVDRTIYGVRAITRLKDAYLKGEYYMQSGEVKQGANSPTVKLGGSGYVVGLGGKQNTEKFGRFGAVAEICSGSGDNANTSDKDEAFRPTFASRWSGLERSGYGNYFAATFSDAYSPTQPFANPGTNNTGLPDGASGIQTIHFGIDATPWSQWTFLFDYYQYKADKSTAGDKELGVEFDYGFLYRFSGLVSVKGMMASFKPGKAFDVIDPTTNSTISTSQNASRSSIELQLKF